MGVCPMTGSKNMLTKELAELHKFADSMIGSVSIRNGLGTFMPKLNALVSPMEDLENVPKKADCSRGIEKR